MHRTSPRLRTIFHWNGVALTVPFVVAGVIGLYFWLSGRLPATVNAADVSRVLVILLGGAAAVYAICRAIAWIASAHAGESTTS